ncbi:MAG TPA: transglycosylase SLT domain-containing protein [Candidatus Acidoferrum sp.]|nr:transglycosylase SLT domain-containing protein [Candidatus Acidoferrum sp.]
MITGATWSWVLAAAAFCGYIGVLPPRAEALTPSALNALQDLPAPTPAQPSVQSPAGAKAPTSTKKTPGSKATTEKKPAASTSKSHYVNTHKRRPVSPRVRRMRQAFVASASLRPMAQQLLQDRSLPAYAGVQAYARAHAKEDAGALAWLVLGYAHVLDKDYAKAIDPLNRAKVHAGDLGDYVDYYLGSSYLQTGRTAEALASLADFSKAHPDSLLVRDAAISYADALLLEGQPVEAATLLEHNRSPLRSDLEFALGRAYAASGQSANAAEVFENIYYTMPTCVEADAASAELKKLSLAPQPTALQLKTRADALMAKRRYADAAEEYRSLVNESGPEQKPAMQLALADALHRSGKNRDAKQELSSIGAVSGEENAQRLYLIGQVAFAANDNDAFYRSVEELRQAAPASPWLEQALLSAANLHLVHHEYDQALDAFRESQQRFPTGARASYVHWKAAWLTLREGRNEDAKKAFEEQIALYPSGAETPAALYWRARLAEEDNQPAMAGAFYRKLSDRYRNFYYAELARQRMKRLPAVAAEQMTQYPLLDRVPALQSDTKITESEPPSDELHVQKAELLGNGGLVDFAVRELQAATAVDGGSWGPAETAQLYVETGHYNQAIEVMKHSTPNYFALDIPDLPRKYWEALFPKAYWSDLKRSSAANGLDPYLVASLIRQESEFNPGAVSRANAVGLMQLLPKTGKVVARQAKMKHYNASQLYTPAVNLQLGTRYFRGMVDKFGGSFEYALAAYNAGSDRVEEWLGQGKYRDPQEFVESIPFTETREYVQAILRNASVYKQIYGTP